MKDDIYIIKPIPGGFEATWGFIPRPDAGSIHEWVKDELKPYTAADAEADALAVGLLLDCAPENDSA